MTDGEAGRLLYLIHGLHCNALFHPSRPRKERYVLSISKGSYGGVHDMLEVGCGKDWEHAFPGVVSGSVEEGWRN